MSRSQWTWTGWVGECRAATLHGSVPQNACTKAQTKPFETPVGSSRGFSTDKYVKPMVVPRRTLHHASSKFLDFNAPGSQPTPGAESSGKAHPPRGSSYLGYGRRLGGGPNRAGRRHS